MYFHNNENVDIFNNDELSIYFKNVRGLTTPDRLDEVLLDEAPAMARAQASRHCIAASAQPRNMLRGFANNTPTAL